MPTYGIGIWTDKVVFHVDFEVDRTDCLRDRYIEEVASITEGSGRSLYLEDRFIEEVTNIIGESGLISLLESNDSGMEITVVNISWIIAMSSHGHFRFQPFTDHDRSRGLLEVFRDGIRSCLVKVVHSNNS